MIRFTILFCLFTVGSIYCNSLFAIIDLIDIPTTEVNERYSMELGFRLYSDGGAVSRILFGVFPQLNIGCSLDIVSLIGTEAPTVRQPTLNLKARIFDGSKKLPAIAIGYDGQGYRYDDSIGRYQDKEKGIYIVGNIEAIVRKLELYFGLSVNFTKENDKDKTDLYGFMGAVYPIQRYEEMVGCFIAEIDSDRCNLGVKVFPVEDFSIGFALKDIIPQKRLPMERLITITYETQF